MKRKMVYAGAAWTAGMFFASVFSPDLQIPAMLIMLLVSAFFFWKTVRKFAYFALSGSFFIAGALYFTLYSSLCCDRIRDYAGEEIFFEGRVTQVSDKASEKSVYRVHGKINSQTPADIICYVSTAGCGYSDKISFRCTPSVFENTFLFNTKDYYESQGCYIQTDRISDVKITENTKPSLMKLFLRYREYASERISSVLPGEYGDFIAAMLTGDKTGLEESTKKELYRSGTGHMMAVSGMHLVLVISLVSSLLGRTSLSGRKRFIITEAAAAVFVMFSGMTVSVLRAAFMMTLILSAQLFGRKTDPLNSLCIASLSLLLFSPYLIRNSSFLLSVSGTFGATVLAPYITAGMKSEGFLNSIKKKTVTVFCISVSVFPFSVMFFDEASLISPVSDIIIIPLCTFALLCGMAAALTGFADVTAYPLLMAGGLASKLVFKISSLLSDTGLSAISLKRGFVPLLTLFLAAFVVFTALRYRNRRNTFISMVISAAVFVSSSFLSGFMNRNVLTVCRVGTSKSAAVVVSAGGSTDVIDLTGNAKTSQYVSKLADICGIHHIDSVTILSNPYQSMASFSERLKLNEVSHVYVPEGTYTGGTPVCRCEPETFEPEELLIDRGKYVIKSSGRGEISIEFGDSTVKCTVTGTETCEGYFTEQNIAVKNSDNGKVKVYRLG